jgi:hypothetical protein
MKLANTVVGSKTGAQLAGTAERAVVAGLRLRGIRNSPALPRGERGGTCGLVKLLIAGQPEKIVVASPANAKISNASSPSLRIPPPRDEDGG